MRLFAVLFFVLCSSYSVSVLSGELWDKCVQEIAAGVPRRGTNTKADQQNYFREKGTLPQLSEIFRIDTNIKAPKTLFESFVINASTM